MELVGVRRPLIRHSRADIALLRSPLLPLAVAVIQWFSFTAAAIWKLSRFNVSSDFGMNNQATFLISHGVLNPFNTIGNDPMWQDQFKLLLWPVGLLRTVLPGSLLLVVLQAAALAAASGLLVHTVQRLASSLPSATSLAVIAASAAVILLEPWTFQAALTDFHAQNLAAPALVLLMGSIILHRHRSWIVGSAGVYLLSGSEAGTVAAAAGLGFLLLRGYRKEGSFLLALGSLWTALILLLHAHQGTPISQVYGYLAGNSHPTLLGILSGMVQHPSRPLHQLAGHGITIAALILMAGTIGLLYPPAGAVACCEILLAGLQQQTNLLDFATGSFQMWPAVALMLCGLPIVAAGFSHWTGRQHPRVRRALVSGAVLLSAATVIGNGLYDTTLPARWNTVSSPAVLALQQAATRIPVGSEVIASNGIVGQFSARSYVYALSSLQERIPLCTRTVAILVAPEAGAEVLPAAVAQHLAAAAVSLPSGRTTAYGSHVTLVQLPVRHPGSSYLRITPHGLAIQHTRTPVSCRNPLIQ